MRLTRWTTALLAAGFLLGGCMKTDIHGIVLPDGSGKVELEFDLDPHKLPFFVKDPLSNVATRQFMRDSTIPGFTHWGPPQRETTDERDHLVLTAYFDDVNDVWLYKSRDGKTEKAFGFAYDPKRDPDTLHLEPHIEEELKAPYPLPPVKSVGIDMELTPSMISGVYPLVKPALEDMRIRIRVSVPGEVVQADGFDHFAANTAAIEIDREGFYAALTQRVGLALDEEGLSLADPVLRWKGASVSSAEMAAFQKERQAAYAWWTKPPSGSKDSGEE